MTDHPVSIEMLEEGHALLLGQTRSGKTYQLRGFLERLRRADRRVGAVDKLGNHWGLTLSADGARPGLDFVIFGGKRAHVPMTPADGGRLGQLFVERSVPAIFDVSQWHHDEQQIWLADFADAVFLHNEGALHLALDEAPSWIPQQMERGAAFRPVQRLATQGLGNGIRLIMASQRWSMIDKTAAAMASVVVTLRQFGSADRKTMRELLPADAADVASMERELASLPAGTGYVWNPGPASLERHSFPQNSTFDSSRTPRHGDAAPAPVTVSSELVDELRKILQRPELGGPGDGQQGEVSLQRRNAAQDGRIEALENALAEAHAQIALFAEARAQRDQYLAAINSIAQLAGDALSGHNRPAEGSAVPQPRAKRAPEHPPTGKGKPPGAASPKAATAMATRIIVQLEDLAPARLTWRQVASLLGYKPDGGYFRAGKRDALASGRLFEEGEYVRAALAPSATLTRADAMVLWARALGEPASRMIDELSVSGPVAREELARIMGYAATGGFFRRGLALLRQNGVITEAGEIVSLADPLPGETQ
jgi:hypothetical protein